MRESAPGSPGGSHGSADSWRGIEAMDKNALSASRQQFGCGGTFVVLETGA